MPSIEELRPQIESKLAESGCVLFDIRYFRAGPRSILRINVDKPNGGITIGECEEVSNELSILLDVEGFSLNRPYTLEVSSPGSDRLLKTEQDYRRIINRYVVIHLKNEIDGNKKVRGKGRAAGR